LPEEEELKPEQPTPELEPEVLIDPKIKVTNQSEKEGNGSKNNGENDAIDSKLKEPEVSINPETLEIDPKIEVVPPGQTLETENLEESEAPIDPKIEVINQSEKEGTGPEELKEPKVSIDYKSIRFGLSTGTVMFVALWAFCKRLNYL